MICEMNLMSAYSEFDIVNAFSVLVLNTGKPGPVNILRGFIRSRLLAVNCRSRCLLPPVTKPHIQESSSCNMKYRNGQKQL